MKANDCDFANCGHFRTMIYLPNVEGFSVCNEDAGSRCIGFFYMGGHLGVYIGFPHFGILPHQTTVVPKMLHFDVPLNPKP